MYRPLGQRNFDLPGPGALVHFMGICGTGMAAVAGLLKQMGYRVRGSDANFYPPMSDLLQALEIPVSLGYDPSNLKPRPDFVVVGNVITRINPEAQALLESDIPYVSFPEALCRFCLKDRRPLVVAGTHGKTTTSTFLVSALMQEAIEPGFMIGGIPLLLGSGFHLGRPPWFVLEGDEYDTAFFDKRPKFLHYRPFGLILTSIEFDHADIYSDLDQIKLAFKELVKIVPPDGIISACWDWEVVRQVCAFAKCRVVTYGTKEGCDLRLLSCHINRGQNRIEAELKIHDECRRIAFTIQLPGAHNALNALGVIALTSVFSGLSLESTIKGLEACKGVRRRQEVIGEIGGVTVIDDFAHHPTAVKETLKALRQRYPMHRLIAVFEPRTNTSRRAIFQDIYPLAFEPADLVLVRQVPQPEKAPAGDRFSSEKLVCDIKALGKEAYFFQDAKAILSWLLENSASGDVVAILSNGDFEGLHKDLLEGLEARQKWLSRSA